MSPIRALFASSFAVLLATAPGCSCSTSNLQCDAEGNCYICDAYGCRPANPHGTGGAGGGGAGGSGGIGGGGAGGSAPCDPTQGVCPCDTEGLCSDGLVCVEGMCIDPCEFSYECGLGKVCKNGACVDECSVDDPCDAGYVCDKGTCVPDAQNPQCVVDGDCAQPGKCVDGICQPACASNTDCAPGQVCNLATGSCIDDPSPTPVCAGNDMCVGIQVCLDDGYCHYPCQTLNDCKLIDNRFVECSAGICKLEEEVSPECTVDQPCPDGKDCISNKCL